MSSSGVSSVAVRGMIIFQLDAFELRAFISLSKNMGAVSSSLRIGVTAVRFAIIHIVAKVFLAFFL